MTRNEAHKAIQANIKKLDDNLDNCTSQFQIKLAYVGAHQDMVDLARKIAKSIPEDDHK